MITQSIKSETKNFKQKLKSLNKNIISFPLLIMTLHFALSILQSSEALAQSFSNPNYNLEINTIDTSAEKPDNSPTIAEVITPQPTKPPVEKNKPGIKNISQSSPITFSISSEIVDFGVLSPGNPIIRDLTLNVLSKSVGFQIITYEDHPLRLTQSESNQGSQIIPDTTCDSGACTEFQDSVWENQLTYGFGYRCDSQIAFICSIYDPNRKNADNSTINSDFMQFADISRNEEPLTIINGQNNEQPIASKITFKLNTNGSQKAGSYSNNITFLLLSNY